MILSHQLVFPDHSVDLFNGDTDQCRCFQPPGDTWLQGAGGSAQPGVNVIKHFSSLQMMLQSFFRQA
jgi:hypothetical protein